MKPGPRVIKWLAQGLALGKLEWEATLGFPLTELFPPPDRCIMLPFWSISWEMEERKWNEENQREEVKVWPNEKQKQISRINRNGPGNRYHFQAAGGMQIRFYHTWWIKDMDDFLLTTHLREPLCITCPPLPLRISSHSSSWADF